MFDRLKAYLLARLAENSTKLAIVIAGALIAAFQLDPTMSPAISTVIAAAIGFLFAKPAS